MTVDQATDIVRQALLLALMISGPILGVGLVVGLIVSLLQAVTQIQEQTLSFVPKIIAMAVTVILILPWAGAKLMEFARDMMAP